MQTSFKNLTGKALEEAVIDEISLRIKSDARVEMRHFDITRISKNMLQNFTNALASIDFQSNSIEDVENESFSKCTKLEKIDLMENRLEKITRDIFSGNFDELHEINLSFNAIESIETGSFDKLSNLKSIDLSSNCIQHLSSDLFKNCESLKHVHLDRNEIAKIELNLFSAKTHLKLLNLSHNRLNFIPEFHMKSIKQYVLSHNTIEVLDLSYEPRGRKKLASIEQLNVAFNNISMCAKLHEMRDDIIHLDVSHNVITTSVFNDFPSLANLEVLNIAHNNITALTLDELDEKFPSIRAINISLNSGFDCDSYKFIRSYFSHISLTVDANFTHHCTIHNIDYYDYHEMIRHHHQNALDSPSVDEILWQLKLNRSLLIILLSVTVIIVIILAKFSLYQRFLNKCKAIKATKSKENLLVENIEL